MVDAEETEFEKNLSFICLNNFCLTGGVCFGIVATAGDDEKVCEGAGTAVAETVTGPQTAGATEGTASGETDW